MKPLELTYDLSRCYLHDRQGTLPLDVYHKVHGFLRARDISRLATCCDLSAPAKIGAEGWRTLMQVEAFFKKNVAFSDDETCRQAAMSSFYRGERICRITNRRLDYYFAKRERIAPDLDKWLSKMEKEISACLGDHSIFLDELPRLVRVTSGATLTKSRREALPPLRVSKRPYCSPGAAGLLKELVRYYGYEGLKCRQTLANRVEFVPKNWKTARTIACEPEGNVFLQLAFDKYIKRRLMFKFGLNLKSQFRNQELAHQGSIDGSVATIDLSMASDTLAFNTVAWMLPHPWFQLLNRVRSPRSRGEIEVNYAKFSSMGNGATFSLETLVFAAAAKAVGSRLVCVYGDDIVIETELVSDLLRLLRFLGFVINTEKSHVAGPFRESCGANWYNGHDVTPVYLRDIDDRKAVVSHMVNSLAAIAEPDGKLWKRLLRLVSEESLPFVPYDGITTSGVWIDVQSAKERKLIRMRRNWNYYRKVYVSTSSGRKFQDYRSLFLWLLRAQERGWRPGSLVDLGLGWELRTAIESSRYTISSHRYRRKWVYWREPAAGAPAHLYRWADDLLRRKAK